MKGCGGQEDGRAQQQQATHAGAVMLIHTAARCVLRLSRHPKTDGSFFQIIPGSLSCFLKSVPTAWELRMSVLPVHLQSGDHGHSGLTFSKEWSLENI